MFVRARACRYAFVRSMILAHSSTMKPACVRKALIIFLNDELLKSFLDYDSYAEFVTMLLHSDNGVLTADLHESYLESIIL